MHGQWRTGRACHSNYDSLLLLWLLELDIVNALNQLNEAVIKGIAPDRHSVMEFEAALDRGVAIVGGSGLQMRAHLVRRVEEIAHHTQTA